MSTRSNIILGVAGLFLAALPTLAKTPPKAKPKSVPGETAVIENTGSTNTKGFRITVHSTGAVVDGKAMGLPAMMNKKLLQDLAAAMPLTSLPTRHGMRSASFGTRTFITYKGQKSPDLTFGGDAHVTALKADVDAIIQELGVVNSPRRPAIQPVPAVQDKN